MLQHVQGAEGVYLEVAHGILDRGHQRHLAGQVRDGIERVLACEEAAERGLIAGVI